MSKKTQNKTKHCSLAPQVATLFSPNEHDSCKKNISLLVSLTTRNIKAFLYIKYKILEMVLLSIIAPDNKTCVGDVLIRQVES